MRARIVSSILILCLSAFAAPAQDEENPIAADIGAAVARDFARPALADLTARARDLTATMKALCAAPGAAPLAEARAAFVATLDAWGRASVLRFGPLAAQNRFERIFFWPDPRGLALRQVQGHLAAPEETLTAADLPDYSVALQGLPALEFVLYGTGAAALEEPGAAHRCGYGAAIAGNLVAVAEAVAAGWRDDTAFYDSLARPAGDKDPYRSRAEVAGEIVEAAGTALQFTRNAELLPALGESVEAARGRRAPFWRSRRTFAFARAQIDGVEGLIEAAGFTDGDNAIVAGIGRSVLFDLDHARETLAEVEAAPEQAFGNEADRARLSYVTVALEGARHNINGSLSGALGLVMGFNALDGD